MIDQIVKNASFEYLVIVPKCHNQAIKNVVFVQFANENSRTLVLQIGDLVLVSQNV